MIVVDVYDTSYVFNFNQKILEESKKVTPLPLYM